MQLSVAFKKMFISGAAVLVVLCAVGYAAAWTGPGGTPAPAGPNGYYSWQNSGAANTSYSAGNVGIGTTNPTDPLTVQGAALVNGIVSATTFTSQFAPYVEVALTNCGGGCASYHTPLNNWYELGIYAHTVLTNNDTSTFTTGSTGRVTVNKAGTYLIRIHTMMDPTADSSGEYGCPYINGTVNCGSVAQEGFKHQYAPAGYWDSQDHQFVYQLAAGTVVSYGYYSYQALAYYAYDYYTAMEILKLN